MQYEFVKKEDTVIETEENKFKKFMYAMLLVIEKTDTNFKILIDRSSIEISFGVNDSK